MDHADVVVVGGGVAGATIALVLARNGLEVCVLEKTRAFRDENRGELMWPWGVREAQSLDVFDVLATTGGQVVRWMDEYSDLDDEAAEPFDLASVIDGVPGSLNVGHPKARQALLDAAERAGATVVRGAQHIGVSTGPRPRATWTVDGGACEMACRLVIGADGRHSRVRRAAEIGFHKGPVEMYATGMLVHGDDIPTDRNVAVREGDTLLLSFPQGAGFARLYHCFPVEQLDRYAAPDRAERFIADCALASHPESARWTTAEPAGPCATFPCGDAWADAVLAEGVALIGDAGGYNNLLIGQGLSLALRDAAQLSALLTATEDWRPEALAPYAEERSTRLARARYLAHFSGWRARFFRDAPGERRRAEALSARDEILSGFPGNIFRGYFGEMSVPVEAMWRRLDELEAEIVSAEA